MENKVKQYRLNLMMSQTQLSNLSGVNRTTISMLEQNKLKDIKSGTMVKLANALGEPVSVIFFSESVN